MKRTLTILLILYIISFHTINILGNDKKIYLQKSSISKKNLLTSSLFNRDADQIFIKNPPAFSTAFSDTVKLLALMVEFQIDDNDKTTGDGSFDLSTPEKPVIDPPPHTRSYFENQLKALANYYHSVSQGLLTIEKTVYPQTFRVPHTMDYYNSEDKQDDINWGLSRLLRDAVLCGDSAGVIFSDYDCYVIFHAGVGKDIDLGFDYTPCDIPSVFLNIDDLQENFDSQNDLYQGISVQDSSFWIEEGIILPETESQENMEIGLLGTMAIMFGFQLGLPALWDTENGISGIGKWGLMDQGSGNYFGLIPAEPCAFSKVFLGWEKPITIHCGDSLKTACSKSVNTNRIYKVPINDHEYFLIENRQHDFNGDSIAVGINESEGNVLFYAAGTLQVESAGVIISVDEYDYGLPGSGILIWHIDEQIILENLAENKINANKNHRGVDLEEADGAQDIGESYGFTSAGSGAEFGVIQDAWYKDNKINKLVNNADEVAFTPDGFPSSRSNSGGNSHIIISHFSNQDSIMNFSVFTDLFQDGFPCYFKTNQDTLFPPLFGDLDGNGKNEIIAADGKSIYAWNFKGAPFDSTDSYENIISVTGDTVFFQSSKLPLEISAFTQSPMIFNINDDLKDEIIIALNNGTIKAFCYTQDNSGDLKPSVIFTWDENNSRITSGLHAVSSSSGISIIIGTSDGNVYSITAAGSTDWKHKCSSYEISGICKTSAEGSIAVTTSNLLIYLDKDGNETARKQFHDEENLTSPVTGPFGIDGHSMTALISGNKKILIYDRINDKYFSTDNKISGNNISALTAGDIDNDSFSEIITSSADKIQCFNHNLSFADYSPFPYYPRNTTLSPPLLADINGNGMIDIIVSSSNGNLEAWQPDGTMIRDFPLTTGSAQPACPLITDLDKDGDIEIAALSERGRLYVWDLPGSYTSESVIWGSYQHDQANSGMFTGKDSSPPEISDLMPDNFVYNYPNPARGNSTTIRYRLKESADIKIEIYDLAGEIVDNFSGPGEPYTDNEVVWDISDIDSGIYFCRVNAKSGRKNKSVICKIAVVK